MSRITMSRTAFLAPAVALLLGPSAAWAQNSGLEPLPATPTPAAPLPAAPASAPAPVSSAPVEAVAPQTAADTDSRTDSRNTETSIPAPQPPRSSEVTGSLQRFAKFSLGFRVDWNASSGYEPFAKKHVMGAFTLDGSQTLLTYRRLSVAVGGEFDAGGSTSQFRSFKSEVTALRFLISAEARYHLHPRLYLSGKLAPGFAWASADVGDPSSKTSRSDSAALFAGDATLGVSFTFTDTDGASKRPLRVWASAEGGVSVSSSHRWGLTTGANDTRELANDLGKFSLTAPLMRMTVGLSL
jgi:hypothetical protein